MKVEAGKGTGKKQAERVVTKTLYSLPEISWDLSDHLDQFSPKYLTFLFLFQKHLVLAEL